jgi:hypothetical protein
METALIYEEEYDENFYLDDQAFTGSGYEDEGQG